MHLIIFTPVLTSRIKYIFNFILKDILQTEVEFTTDRNAFSQSDKVQISYADKALGNELFFKSVNLLLSNKVEEFKIRTVPFGDYVAPFPVEASGLPFDVFAASFFMLSRYEEYLYHQKSKLDFNAKDSFQYKWKLLTKPIIDEWALILKNMIRTKHPSFKFPEKKFFHQPTINFTLKPDVPNGFLLKTGFVFSSLLNKRQNYLSTLFKDLVGLSINTETLITDLARLKTPPIYFINFPENKKNKLTFKNSRHLLKDKRIGLLRPCKPDKEELTSLKANLSNLIKIQNGSDKVNSQQMETLKLPNCYLQIISSGITSDYSMGYSDAIGFRAGTCTPFNWYDLQLEKITSLNVKPYAISNTALHDQGIKEITQTINNLIDAIKLVNGHFYSAWQLKSLSENVKFKKWKLVFDEMLKYAG